VFSTPVFFNLTSNTTTPYVIKEVIDKINDMNTNAGTGVQIKYSIGSGSGDTIKTIKSDGTPITKSFDQISDYWKPAYQLIEDYSTTEKTGDAYPFMAFIKINSSGQSYFHWEPRVQTVTSTNLVEGVDGGQIKISYASDVINAVIGNCGIDARGNGITVFVADTSSIAKHGAKWKYEGKWRETAENLMSKERDTNSGDFEDDSNFPASYNYTTVFGTVCTSDKTYNTAIRDESKRIVKQNVRDNLRGTFDPKMRVSMEIMGTNNYELGNYIPFQLSSYGVGTLNLRLVDVSDGFWDYELTCEEDTPGGSR